MRSRDERQAMLSSLIVYSVKCLINQFVYLGSLFLFTIATIIVAVSPNIQM